MYATASLRAVGRVALGLLISGSTAMPGKERGSSGGGASGATDAGIMETTTGASGTFGTGAGGAPPIIVPDASLSDSSNGVDATCAGSTTVAEIVPLDLLIMLDQST